MSSVRLRRLQSDYEHLVAFTRRQPRVRLIQAEGEPPERYQLEYHVRGLRQVEDELKVVEHHIVEIALPRNYPRTPPQCRMLTPVFHPNIAPHAICIGDHWSAGEPLWSMVVRIGEMIAYQSYNTKSPLNGEAARWVDQNQDRIPLDPSAIYVEETGEEAAGRAAPFEHGPTPSAPRHDAIPVARIVSTPAVAGPASPGAGQATGQGASPAPSPSGASASQPRIAIQCPQCAARYRVPATSAGKSARCPKCQATIPIPLSVPEP